MTRYFIFPVGQANFFKAQRSKGTDVQMLLSVLLSNIIYFMQRREAVLLLWLKPAVTRILTQGSGLGLIKPASVLALAKVYFQYFFYVDDQQVTPCRIYNRTYKSATQQKLYSTTSAGFKISPVSFFIYPNITSLR